MSERGDGQLPAPGPVPGRWRELRAALGWILRSNVEPADSPAHWQQRAGSRPALATSEQESGARGEPQGGRSATQSSATSQ